MKISNQSSLLCLIFFAVLVSGCTTLNSVDPMKLEHNASSKDEFVLDTSYQLNISTQNSDSCVKRLLISKQNQEILNETSKISFEWEPQRRGNFELFGVLENCNTSQEEVFLKEIEVVDSGKNETSSNFEEMSSGVNNLESKLSRLEKSVNTPSGIEILSLILLFFTAGISIRSLTFQKQTGVRESIEQLNEIVTGSWKMKPILHKFNTLVGLRGKTQIDIKFYSIHREKIAGAGRPKSAQRTVENRIDISEFEEIDNVISAKILDTSLRLECSTIDAIECRNIADEAMNKIYSRIK